MLDHVASRTAPWAGRSRASRPLDRAGVDGGRYGDRGATLGAHALPIAGIPNAQGTRRSTVPTRSTNARWLVRITIKGAGARAQAAMDLAAAAMVTAETSAIARKRANTKQEMEQVWGGVQDELARLQKMTEAQPRTVQEPAPDAWTPPFDGPSEGE